MNTILPRDVARCPGKDCPERNECARYLAGLSGEQGLTRWFLPLIADGECGEKIPIDDCRCGGAQECCGSLASW